MVGGSPESASPGGSAVSAAALHRPSSAGAAVVPASVGASAVAAAGPLASMAARFLEKSLTIRDETSWMIPRPMAAAGPLSDTSAVMSPCVRVPSSVRRRSTVASARPCPRVSRARALKTAWWVDSSLSTISISPRYCWTIGPMRILIATR